jgi:hypothetical protein
VSSQEAEQTLSAGLCEAVAAADSIYENPGWAEWAREFEGSHVLLRGAALKASAIAGAEADRESGRRHFAALAAFHAATAIAWAAGGEETAARQSCQFAKRNADRARESQ